MDSIEKSRNFSIENVLIVTVFLCLSISAYSQSRYLENGIGGSCFAINTYITDAGLSAIGASAAYSIGGIMDVGFRLNRESGSIQGSDSTQWNFNFLYNIIVIKQSDFIPLSLQLEGGYGFSNVSSDFLTAEDITREGQGFNIGASVFREFNSKGLISFLVGGKASYRNYMFTEVDSTSTPVTTTDRNEEFFWGGIAGVSFKPERWPIFTIELEALYNQQARGISLQPSLLIISPSF